MWVRGTEANEDWLTRSQTVVWNQITWSLGGQAKEFRLYLKSNALPLKYFKKGNFIANIFFRLQCGGWKQGTSEERSDREYIFEHRAKKNKQILLKCRADTKYISA